MLGWLQRGGRSLLDGLALHVVAHDPQNAERWDWEREKHVPLELSWRA